MRWVSSSSYGNFVFKAVCNRKGDLALHGKTLVQQSSLIALARSPEGMSTVGSMEAAAWNVTALLVGIANCIGINPVGGRIFKKREDQEGIVTYGPVLKGLDLTLQSPTPPPFFAQRNLWCVATWSDKCSVGCGTVTALFLYREHIGEAGWKRIPGGCCWTSQKERAIGHSRRCSLNPWEMGNILSMCTIDGSSV